MSTVTDAAAALEAAVKTVPKVRVYTDPSAVIDPPGAVIGPPGLEWESVCVEPTAARFLIYAVVALDPRATERLWDLVPQIAQAVDERVADATVVRATPGVFNAGGQDLPCYEIEIEVSL